MGHSNGLVGFIALFSETLFVLDEFDNVLM